MRQAAVLGSPIGHSLSPALHLAAYRALGLDWRYSAVEMRPEGLPEFVASRDDSWVGLSLTMPLKEAALALAATRSETAERTGAANTLLLPGRQAHNTDVDGIVVALRRAGFDPGGPFPAAILGSGATARSAVLALARLGAGHVTVVARNPETGPKVVDLVSSLGMSGEHRDATVRGVFGDLVISTLPAGGADGMEIPADLGGAWLLDVAYRPWPSELANRWRAAGGRPVWGGEMLLAQAERQVELMTGMPAPTDSMRQALTVASQV